MGHTAHDAKLQTLFCAGHACQKAAFAVVGEGATEGITHLVGESGDAGQLLHVGFHGQLLLRIGTRSGTPPLAIYKYGGIYLVHLGTYLAHSLDVVDAHEVEAEPVNVIFVNPILDRLDHETPHQGLLRCRLVAAARTVGGRTVGLVAIVVAGIGALEIAAFEIKRVVVHHIENHPYAGLVQGLHHLLELADAHGRRIGVGGIAALGHVVVERVIAPVVLGAFEMTLVHGGIIERGQYVNGIDVQLLQMSNGSGFGQGQKLAFMLQSGGSINGEIAMMHLIDNKVGRRLGCRSAVGFPPLGIGGGHVYHGSACAIYAHGLGKDTGSLPPTHVKCVKTPLEIALDRGGPKVLSGRPELDRLDQFSARSGIVKAEHRTDGGIKLEYCLLGSVGHFVERFPGMDGRLERQRC